MRSQAATGSVPSPPPPGGVPPALRAAPAPVLGEIDVGHEGAQILSVQPWGGGEENERWRKEIHLGVKNPENRDILQGGPWQEDGVQ